MYLQCCLVVTRLGPRETAAVLTHVLRAHSRQRLLTCHSVVKTMRSRKPDIWNYIRYTAAVDCVKQCQVHGRGGLFIRYRIQTHKKFKRTLFIRTKHNMRIFVVIPVSSSYKTTRRQQINGEQWDAELRVRQLSGFGWAVLFSCPVLGRSFVLLSETISTTRQCETISGTPQG